MDQKHDMLYPDPSTMPINQRSSAAAAIGLPVEPPPTYDVATKVVTPSSTSIGWTSNAADINYPSASHYSPHVNRNHLPVIVEQTSFPLPGNEHPHQPLSQQQQTDALTINAQPTGNLSSKLGPNPSTVTCPNCGANKTTRMCYTPNTKTHLSAFVLCLIGWCCCACIVPYCMNSCRTGNHYCSNCNAFLGAYSSGSHHRRRRR